MGRIPAVPAAEAGVLGRLVYRLGRLDVERLKHIDEYPSSRCGSPIRRPCGSRRS